MITLGMYYQHVKLFNKTFNCKFDLGIRLGLVVEELGEYVEAHLKGHSMQQKAEELGDVLYVLLGWLDTINGELVTGESSHWDEPIKIIDFGQFQKKLLHDLSNAANSFTALEYQKELNRCIDLVMLYSLQQCIPIYEGMEKVIQKNQLKIDKADEIKISDAGKILKLGS